MDEEDSDVTGMGESEGDDLGDDHPDYKVDPVENFDDDEEFVSSKDMFDDM
jgi:hypothetical protein